MTSKRAKLLQWYNAQKFDIMALPWDVRHNILEYICDRTTMPVFLRNIYGWSPTGTPLPAIARAGDRRLRLETILVSIKQTTLEIHSGPGNANLQEWLNSLNFTLIGEETGLRKGVDAIHSLSFPYFSRFPHQSLPVTNPNKDMKLMLKCSNLRKVNLLFVNQELVHHPIGLIRAESVVQLRQEYRLDSMLPLFRWGALKKIILRGPQEGLTGHAALQALAAWFRLEYAIRANMARLGAKKPAKFLTVLINEDL